MSVRISVESVSGFWWNGRQDGHGVRTVITKAVLECSGLRGNLSLRGDCFHRPNQSEFTKYKRVLFG